MLIIGLVGEKGAGKDTFCKLLQEILPSKKVVRVSTSTLLSKTLELWDLPKSRSNLQQLAILIDAIFGVGTVANGAKSVINSTDADIIVYDSVRWQNQYDMIRSLENNLVVYITTDLNTRFQRIKERKEKEGEGNVTLEQFIEEEKISTETEIPSLGDRADFKIENSGDLDEFREDIKNFTQKLNL